MTVPLSYYLILSAVVFLTGVVGVLIRRNIIIRITSYNVCYTKLLRCWNRWKASADSPA